ncbi:MAG: DUF4097 family beta strand repeat protein [Eubacterium sp.]|nr:DUF4097 family beta strand repeat protein [Eubacterium sp.]
MMDKKIRNLIDEIFADMKMSAENLALRDELMANAQARYEDRLANGMTEDEAFAEVAASLDDVRATLAEMNKPEEKASEEELGNSFGKAFDAIGEFGKQLVPQMTKMVRQADEATGGVMSGIGKAVIKGTVDMGKAAGEAFDRLQKNMAEQAKRPVNLTPDEMLRRAKEIRTQAEIKEAEGEQEAARDLRRKAYELETRAQAELEAEMIRKAEEQKEEPEESAAPDTEPETEMDPEELCEEAEKIAQEAEKAAPGYETAKDGTVIITHLPLEGIHTLDVGMDADDVELEFAEDDQITVCWEGTGDNSLYPEAEVEDETGILRIRRKNPDVFKTFFSVFKKQGGKLRVSVPNGALLDYRIGTTSGDVTVFQVDAGSLEINSTSGKITVQGNPSVPYRTIRINAVSGHVDVKAHAKEIHASSVSGSVTVSGRAEVIDSNVVSGKILITGAFDCYDVDSVSGSVQIVCEEVPTDCIKIGTLSGTSKLTLPRDTQGFVVETSSLSGTVSNEFGPNRYGTCQFPIRFDSVSGKLSILKSGD